MNNHTQSVGLRTANHRPAVVAAAVVEVGASTAAVVFVVGAAGVDPDPVTIERMMGERGWSPCACYPNG